VLCEDCAAEWFNFAKGDGAHPGSFKAESESTDSTEEVKNPQSLMLSQPMRHGRLGADRVLQQQAHPLDLAFKLCNPHQ